MLEANKYNLDFQAVEVNNDVSRLTNQLWKLIPMREHNEDWKKQLETVIIEIVGLNEIFLENSNLLQLLSKLEGVRIEENTFDIYRKTIFECISLLRGSIK